MLQEARERRPSGDSEPRFKDPREGDRVYACGDGFIAKVLSLGGPEQTEVPVGSNIIMIYSVAGRSEVYANGTGPG